MRRGGMAFVETNGRRRRAIGIGRRYAGLRREAVVGALIVQTQDVWGSYDLSAILRVGHFEYRGVFIARRLSRKRATRFHAFNTFLQIPFGPSRNQGQE